MHRLVISLGALGLMLSAANADIVTVNVTGTVRDYDPTIAAGTNPADWVAIDRAGLFGTAGARLTGDAFTVNWVFDTTCGSVCGFAYDHPDGSSAVGGTSYNGLSPIISATLTIDGHSVSFGSGINGVLQGYHSLFPNAPIGFRSGTTQSVTGQSGQSLDTFINSNAFLLPASIREPFSYTADASDNLSTHGIGGGFRFNGSIGYFDIDTVTLDNLTGYVATVFPPPPPPVSAPGPIAGAGLPGLGCALFLWLMRRRRPITCRPPSS